MAAWPDGVDVKDKRVAVVGSGASGYQTTPVIAETAAHTYLFQRQANWCLEDEIYLKNSRRRRCGSTGISPITATMSAFASAR